MKLLKLIIYLKKFNKDSKIPLKDNKELKGYFVKADFLIDIEKTHGYKIMDDYIKKNINIQNIIYEHKMGFFEQNDTIIIENKPICIIYLNRNHINKIYLINDQSSIEDEKDIKDVLIKIKNDLCDFMKNKTKV